MVKRNASILLLASSLLVLPAAATAQSDKAGAVTPTAAGKGKAVTPAALVERYGVLAGSPENAKSLVNGLHTKSEVVMVGPAVVEPGCKFKCPTTETVRFTPQTEPMGLGNVDIALALLEADLKEKQLAAPKPRHVKAGLVGEPVSNVNFEGILKLRASGMGWGEIAKTLGFDLK
jgi:hypothetical protein